MFETKQKTQISLPWESSKPETGILPNLDLSKSTILSVATPCSKVLYNAVQCSAEMCTDVVNMLPFLLWPRGHCLVLYYTVLHYTVLHCTALHCTALYCTTLYCTVLHCTALHCTVLHYTALHCIYTWT